MGEEWKGGKKLRLERMGRADKYEKTNGRGVEKWGWGERNGNVESGRKPLRNKLRKKIKIRVWKLVRKKY